MVELISLEKVEAVVEELEGACSNGTGCVNRPLGSGSSSDGTSEVTSVVASLSPSVASMSPAGSATTASHRPFLPLPPWRGLVLLDVNVGAGGFAAQGAGDEEPWDEFKQMAHWCAY